MSSWPECDASLDRAHGAGSKWNYCTVAHCDELTSYNHDFCHCGGEFSVYPYVQNGICMTAAGNLIPIADQHCFCCCSCFANDTPIAVTKGSYKAVQNFVVHDPVLVAEGADLKSWVQKPVLFSSGTGVHGQNKLIKVHFGDQTKGVTLTQDSFVSQFINKELSSTYFKILSTAPNDYIDKNGLVNLQRVKTANVDVIAKLLGATVVVAQKIFDILSTDTNYLLVTGIQPFLMKDKTLKQAHKLVPGKDELVREDGSTTPIISLEVGMFHKGVHHIATSNKPAESLDGHLLLANGIVVGDYAAQLSLASSGKSIHDAHADAPTFGTKEYNDQHTHLATTPFSAHASSTRGHKADLFDSHHPDKSAHIPKNAASFISKAQADKLLHYAPIFPASNNSAEPDVRYLFRLFGAFYPEITFYYDQNNMFPNAYGFQQYGRKFVVVTHGWTQIEGIYFPGIALTIAHMVAALNDGSLPGKVNLIGAADYAVYPIFLSLFYHASDAVDNYNLALEQIKKVFGYIEQHEKHKKHVGEISLKCRIKTFEASIVGYPLPHCAGGAPDPALEVVEVSATNPKNSDAPVVSITFNLPVDPDTATGLGNYLLDPAATAFSAAVDDSDPKKVHLVADIKPDTEYYLVATGVLSVNKQPMVRGKNGGKFILKGSA